MTAPGSWQFWIDRGGTFTDVVARRPDASLITRKLLSDNPENYADAAIEGVRMVIGVAPGEPIPGELIEAVKMGTTVATNALLEHKGEATVLLVTKGFADALRIAYQNRPRLFDRHIVLPDMLYSRVIEVDERIDAHGNVLKAPDLEALGAALGEARKAGLTSAAIAFMHAYRTPEHERAAAALAKRAGFTQVSVSHEVSPLMKLVSRGDTTVVDAYLTPILRRYVDGVAAALGGARLMFMQSNGGLTGASNFHGKDSILSGPAAGVVGMARTAARAGFAKVIGFDMGGTSTDVSHYDGEFERTFESEIAGVRMRSPMMLIHTVAAGGGSILHFDGARMRVGPESAGANPGPACYRRGGPLTLTDCNLLLGRIQPRFFPRLFGPGADQPLDAGEVRARFGAFGETINRPPEKVAEGFLKIAVENMANAIKRISVQRGYDVTEYTLNCFGGAGGQHACLVADALGISRVFIHAYAGVLSAYGLGLAETRAMREETVEEPLADGLIHQLEERLVKLDAVVRAEVESQGTDGVDIISHFRVHLRYQGTDTALAVTFGPLPRMVEDLEAAHRARFGFAEPGRALIVEAVSAEAEGATGIISEAELPPDPASPEPLEMVGMYDGGVFRETLVFERASLPAGAVIAGPAIIAEANSTTVVEPGWRASLNKFGHLVLTRADPRPSLKAETEADPVMLEVFNNLFMSIAEQMGAVLANTAYSVNIKERLDFSCAVFDGDGHLVANAPHMPVHLGSMGESVRTVIRDHGESIRPGSVYALNAPYNGGTHLPDVTVVTPVFDVDEHGILFFTASRGHHADIGGVTPGSMPPHSTSVEEEGVLIDDFQLVEDGRFHEIKLLELLANSPYPARNPQQNVADLKAQIAANEKGVAELGVMVDHFGLEVVSAYMGHVRANAADSVRRVLDVLKDGAFEHTMDDGALIKVRVSVDREQRRAVIDFSGTSEQRPNNFNAPFAVARAAVLYVFRTLVDDDIPLNAGCLEPLEIIAPQGCLLNPRYPAAVVAGNVETSQAVVDALYGALGVMAASQGTMNNFTFGDDQRQYYETICGGSGAGPGFDGCDAVHTHMTNSRLTDPEVLEWRYPVLVEDFSIRRNSGGKGEFKGGDGAVRRIKFLEPMTAAILSSMRTQGPKGMAGGGDGKPGANRVERADGTVEELLATATTEMGVGDVFVIETPGGGGYGEAEEEEKFS